MAPEIRVALVDLPPLLQEIVSRALTAASDVDIVGHYADRESLIQAVPLAYVNAIVIAADRAERTEVAKQLLALAPHLAVFSLCRDDRDLVVNHLILRSATVRDVSASGLVEAIRSTATPCGGDA